MRLFHQLLLRPSKRFRIPGSVAFFLGLVFIVLIGIGSFKYHLIGDWDVETDFYWDYAPAAEELIHGEIDISHYRFRGPGYPLLLVPLIVLLEDSFLAARFLALIAAAVTLWFAYRISSRTINPVWGVWIVVALALNHHFSEYSFRAGTDMPFLALCTVVCYLLTIPRVRGLEILLGVICGYAFLTRYNGAVLIVICVLWVLLNDRSSNSKTRVRRLGLLIIGLAPIILPWMLILYLNTGNPFYSLNSFNILYGLYDANKITWDQFWYSNSVNGSGSLTTTVLQNPMKLILTFANNLVTHFPEDMSKLVNWKLGWSVVAGIIYISFRRFRIGNLGWVLAVGIAVYTSLCLVFYNIRFSLPLLPIYLLVVCYLFASLRISLDKRLFKWKFEFVLTMAFLVVIIGTPANIRGVIYKMRRGPHEIREFVDNDVLESLHPGRMAARKPHGPYHLGHEFVPIPLVKSINELVEWMKNNGIEYLFLSRYETLYRPFLYGLLNYPDGHPQLQSVAHRKALPRCGVWKVRDYTKIE